MGYWVIILEPYFLQLVFNNNGEELSVQHWSITNCVYCVMFLLSFIKEIGSKGEGAQQFVTFSKCNCVSSYARSFVLVINKYLIKNEPHGWLMIKTRILNCRNPAALERHIQQLFPFRYQFHTTLALIRLEFQKQKRHSFSDTIKIFSKTQF